MVFVIGHHGLSGGYVSNATNLHDDIADAEGWDVVSPYFPSNMFDSDSYQKGGVAPGIAQADWTVRLEAEVVKWARRRWGNGDFETPFYIWGHSAGAQWVSRVAAFAPIPGCIRYVIANPSTWVWPDLTIDAPHGMGGMGLTNTELTAYLALPMTVYYGENDTSTVDLDQSAEANAQGANRRTRAENFHAAGLAAASTLSVPCNWTLVMAAGIGHTNGGMLGAAELYEAFALGSTPRGLVAGATLGAPTASSTAIPTDLTVASTLGTPDGPAGAVGRVAQGGFALHGITETKTINFAAVTGYTPVEGDTVIVMTASDGGETEAPGFLVSSGWTEHPNNDPGGSGPGKSCYIKTMGSTPDTQIQFSHTSNSGTAGLIQVWDNLGVPNGTPWPEINGATGLPDCPSITTTVDNTRVFALGFLDDDDSGGAITAPTGYEEVFSADTGNGGASGATVMIASKALATAGAEDPGVFGGTGTDAWYAFTIAYTETEPVGGGGGGGGADITLTSTYGFTDYDVTGLASDTTIDATAASWIVQNSGSPQNPYPVTVRDSPSVEFYGGLVLGEISQSSDWVDQYAEGNSASLSVRGCPGAIIRDWRIDSCWDAFRMTDESAAITSNFLIEDCWVTNARDDFVENDKFYVGTVRDCLSEAWMNISIADNAATSQNTNVITLDKVLIAPKTYLDGGTQQQGSAVKMDDFSMRVVMTDCVIRIGGSAPMASNSHWTRLWNGLQAGSSNNLLIWASDLALPAAIGTPHASFTVLQGATHETLWQTIRQNWIDGHPDLRRISGDPASTPANYVAQFGADWAP